MIIFSSVLIVFIQVRDGPNDAEPYHVWIDTPLYNMSLVTHPLKLFLDMNFQDSSYITKNVR